MKRRRSPAAIFAWPVVIGLSGIVGLVSALTGDGWRDLLSWGGLAIPLAATLWAMTARRG